MYSGADTLTGGFPHSEIRGSTIARISPQLIAACHVLHRLLAPRHPPNALIALNTYHQCPHAGPNPTTQSSAYQTNRLSFTHSLFCSRHHHPAQSSRPHSTAGLVTNQSDSPVKHHAPRIRSLQRTHHQAANPLCSGTPSSKEHPSGHSTHQTKPLETVGIEPTAPCLQSRCSTTELRPHIPRTSQHNRQDQPSRTLASPRSHRINGGPRRT